MKRIEAVPEHLRWMTDKELKDCYPSHVTGVSENVAGKLVFDPSLIFGSLSKTELEKVRESRDRMTNAKQIVPSRFR